MIEKIEVMGGGGYEVEEALKKYAVKRIGKLDKFLPKKGRKDVIAKVVVSKVNRPHGNKYEITAALDIPGGKVITAKDEASNVFAGVDILEAKLMGQIRKLKAEQKPRKGAFKKIFFK